MQSPGDNAPPARIDGSSHYKSHGLRVNDNTRRGTNSDKTTQVRTWLSETGDVKKQTDYALATTKDMLRKLRRQLGANTATSAADNENFAAQARDIANEEDNAQDIVSEISSLSSVFHCLSVEDIDVFEAELRADGLLERYDRNLGLREATDRSKVVMPQTPKTTVHVADNGSPIIGPLSEERSLQRKRSAEMRKLRRASIMSSSRIAAPTNHQPASHKDMSCEPHEIPLPAPHLCKESEPKAKSHRKLRAITKWIICISPVFLTISMPFDAAEVANAAKLEHIKEAAAVTSYRNHFGPGTKEMLGGWEAERRLPYLCGFEGCLWSPPYAQEL